MGLTGFDVIYEELPHVSGYHKKILFFAGLAGMYQFGHLRSLPLFYNQKPRSLVCAKNVPHPRGHYVSWNESEQLNVATCKFYTNDESAPLNIRIDIDTLTGQNSSGAYNSSLKLCDVGAIQEEEYTTAPIDFMHICQDNYKSALYLSIALFGCTVGGLFGGMITDTFGRMRSMQVASFAMILSLVATSIAGTLRFDPLFLIGQFTMMFASEIAFGAFIGYTMEVLGPSGKKIRLYLKKLKTQGRSWVGVLANVTANAGMIVVTLFAYLIPDWKMTVYASAGVMFVGLLMQCLCPESPRWLHQKLSREQSRPKVIKFIESVKSDVDSLALYEKIVDINTSSSKKTAWISPTILFSRPFLVKYTVATLLGGFTFYLSLWMCIFGSGHLAGSVYVNNMIPAAVAAATSPLAAWAMDSPLGRRGAIIMYGTISGFSVFGAFLVDFFIPGNTYSRWLVMFARVLIILMGSCHLNYTGELYPTEIRGNALSMRALFGSIATIITPQLLKISRQGYWWLPNICMGTLTLTTSFAYKFMPETHKKPLAQTVAEAEALLTEQSDDLLLKRSTNRDDEAKL